MFQIIHSIALCGMDGLAVRVEADVRDGFPSFEMVGYLSGQVKEAGGRVRSALYNSGYRIEPKRITINLSPANVKKEGNAFDLPIAVAIVSPILKIPEEKLNKTAIVGELGLDGSVHRVQGILPVVCTAREKGFSCCIVPRDNVREAEAAGLPVCGVSSLTETLDFLTGAKKFSTEEGKTGDPSAETGRMDLPDFSDIAGQESMKRAAIVAAAGWHNLLIVGSAGSGKTLLAKSLPGILPAMSREEQLEVSKVYSTAGLLDGDHYLVSHRPFRTPHHSITRAALTGGGRIPKAGEISLAHLGVLFLDELPEFRIETIEALRQPMEERKITLTRSYGAITYPADFLTVAAMNPCRCGFYPDRNRCHCNEMQVRQYLNRISGPLLERMDILAVAEPVSFQSLTGKENGETSAVIRERIGRAWQIQRERLAEEGISFNSRMDRKQTERYCGLGAAERRLLENAFEKFGISARVYHKILKTARTIADLAGEEQIREEHLGEAILYRSAVKRFWPTC